MSWYGVFNVLGWVVGLFVIVTGFVAGCLLVCWLTGALMGRFAWCRDAADSSADLGEMLMRFGPLLYVVGAVKYCDRAGTWLRRSLVAFGASAAVFVAGSIVFENFVR